MIKQISKNSKKTKKVSSRKKFTYSLYIPLILRMTKFVLRNPDKFRNVSHFVEESIADKVKKLKIPV